MQIEVVVPLSDSTYEDPTFNGLAGDARSLSHELQVQREKISGLSLKFSWSRLPGLRERFDQVLYNHRFVERIRVVEPAHTLAEFSDAMRFFYQASPPTRANFNDEGLVPSAGCGLIKNTVGDFETLPEFVVLDGVHRWRGLWLREMLIAQTYVEITDAVETLRSIRRALRRAHVKSVYENWLVPAIRGLARQCARVPHSLEDHLALAA